MKINLHFWSNELVHCILIIKTHSIMQNVYNYGCPCHVFCWQDKGTQWLNDNKHKNDSKATSGDVSTFQTTNLLVTFKDKCEIKMDLILPESLWNLTYIYFFCNVLSPYSLACGTCTQQLGVAETWKGKQNRKRNGKYYMTFIVLKGFRLDRNDLICISSIDICLKNFYQQVHCI